ncbi:hypothetical protein DM02DRAFT_80559 [Periconia macrospinosa]|uniref:Uncharacterized protein n=1 Tax=Periconia macrospinosa TaxID=97972 RepID=A0A2V1DHB8_9PLEO|nr:hypothetical protein DM02DRAFT_80559 [Periconia macrospinosa]
MDLPFGYSHSNKRSHAQMDLEDSASPRWSPFSNPLSATREPSAGASRSQQTNINLPRIDLLDPPMPRRYPGDGLDYRRPMSSSNNVIDLTEEDAGPSPTLPRPNRPAAPRPPRFGREIIDLAEDEPQEMPGPQSPEIQFVSSRPIPSTRQPSQRPIDLDAGDDEVEFVSERRRSIPQSLVQAMLSLPRLRAAVVERRQAERQRQATMTRFTNNAARSRSGSNAGPRPPPRRIPNHFHLEFSVPQMHYGAVAFNLGFPHDEPSSPEPTYDAPPEAPAGFTRSPQEEDSLICPNCEEELCVGDNEQKKQVWIVKQCGHVYCGECTTHRWVSKSTAKGKERQSGTRKPFKECVVDGCNKKVSSHKAMIQVFL